MNEPRILVTAQFADGVTRKLEIVKIDGKAAMLTSKKFRRYLRRMKYLSYKEWCKSVGVTPQQGKKFYRAKAKKIILALINES